MNSDSTLVDVLKRHAASCPDRRLYTFLADGDTESGAMTYSQLDAAANSTAALLLESATPGDRAVLLYPVGLEYLVGLFGCMYAGLVAVPAYPWKSDKRSSARIRAMVGDCRPRLVLTCERMREGASSGVGELRCDPAPTVLATDGQNAYRQGATTCPARISADALAILQYTSGSIGDPKGVRITHANLMANQEMIRNAMRHDEDSHFVSWLPPYHDMGLIGNLFQPLFLGASCAFMPPAAFIQKPARWLAAISKYGARTSGAPTFAYDLCVKKVLPQRDPGLDLSRWTVAYCGAETVDASVFERFCERFAAEGFRKGAFYPCYGLAEATLMVTGSDARGTPVILEADGDLLERGALRECTDGGRRLVGCGSATSGSEVAIVHPETCEALPQGDVGEIWVAGPHVADGYWGRPEDSREIFHATIPGRSNGYLRTGDLGALVDGELYVVGRIKEIILHRGRNLSPVDIESVAASTLGDAASACAAFALRGECTEDIGIVVEAARRGFDARDVGRLGDAVAHELYRAFEIEPALLAFVRIGSIPRTSSGKKQRLLCGRLLTQGRLDVLAEYRRPKDGAGPEGEAEGERAWLARWIHRFTDLPMERILNGPGGAAGWSLESLRAVELLHEIERRHRVALPVSTLYQAESLDAVVQEIERRVNARKAAIVTSEPDSSSAAAEPATCVTPNQEAVWFSQQIDPNSPAYHLAWMLRFPQSLDSDRLRESVRTVIARHDALRQVFRLTPSGQLAASVLPGGTIDYEQSTGSASELQGWIQRQCDRPFRLDSDLLVRVRHGRGSHADLVGFVAHHIVSDLWSCALFTEEVFEHYVTGALPERPRSYREFASYVGRRAAEGDSALRYWRERLEDAPTIDPIDVLTGTASRPPIPRFEGASVEARCDREASDSLLECARSHHVSRQVVFLSLYGLWLWSLTRLEDFVSGSLASGRTRAMFSRMQGLLVNPFAVRFQIEPGASLGKLFAAVREQTLGGLEHEAYPFHLVVRDLATRTRSLNRAPLFQNLFVYQQLPSSSSLSGCVMPGAQSRFVHKGLEIECVPLPSRCARFDFTLYVMENGSEFSLHSVYRSPLFDRPQVQAMLERFTSLVARLKHMRSDSCVKDLVSEYSRRSVRV